MTDFAQRERRMITVGVRLPEETVQQLDEMAIMAGSSRSAMVRHIIAIVLYESRKHEELQARLKSLSEVAEQ